MGNLTITAADVAAVRIDEQDTYPAAEAITAGQVVRLDVTTGKWALAKGTDTGEYRAGGLALRSVAAGITLTALRKGVIDLGDALGDLAYDADVYLSDTDGTLATSQGSQAKIIGQVVPVWGHTTPDKALRINL